MSTALLIACTAALFAGGSWWFCTDCSEQSHHRGS